MAKKSAEKKLVIISGSVTPELKEALEDYRWTVRQTMSAVVADAIAEFLASKGVEVPAAVEAAPES